MTRKRSAHGQTSARNGCTRYNGRGCRLPRVCSTNGNGTVGSTTKYAYTEETLTSSWSRSDRSRVGVSAPVEASMTLYSFLRDSTSYRVRHRERQSGGGDGIGATTSALQRQNIKISALKTRQKAGSVWRKNCANSRSPRSSCESLCRRRRVDHDTLRMSRNIKNKHEK